MKQMILIITAVLMLTACGGVREPRNAEDETIYVWRTVTYDGHEYVKVTDGENVSIAHKPNCKYCEKKNDTNEHRN